MALYFKKDSITINSLFEHVYGIKFPNRSRGCFIPLFKKTNSDLNEADLEKYTSFDFSNWCFWYGNSKSCTHVTCDQLRQSIKEQTIENILNVHLLAKADQSDCTSETLAILPPSKKFKTDTLVIGVLPSELASLIIDVPVLFIDGTIKFTSSIMEPAATHTFPLQCFFNKRFESDSECRACFVINSPHSSILKPSMMYLNNGDLIMASFYERCKLENELLACLPQVLSKSGRDHFVELQTIDTNEILQHYKYVKLTISNYKNDNYYKRQGTIDVIDNLMAGINCTRLVLKKQFVGNDLIRCFIFHQLNHSLVAETVKCLSHWSGAATWLETDYHIESFSSDPLKDVILNNCSAISGGLPLMKTLPFLSFILVKPNGMFGNNFKILMQEILKARSFISGIQYHSLLSRENFEALYPNVLSRPYGAEWFNYICTRPVVCLKISTPNHEILRKSVLLARDLSEYPYPKNIAHVSENIKEANENLNVFFFKDESSQCIQSNIQDCSADELQASQASTF